MDDYDIDAEIAKLLSTASQEQESSREGDAYYTESLEEERQRIVAAFFDHMIAVEMQINGEMTEDDLFEQKKTGYDQDFIDQVYELLYKDLQRNEVLLSGEMKLTGTFPYMPYSEQYWSDAGIIEDEAYLVGKVNRYLIGPMVSYARFMDIQNGIFENTDDADDDEDAVHDVLGVWVVMSDVEVTEATGYHKTHEVILAPMTFPSLTMEKVMRLSNALPTELDTTPQPLNLEVHFKGDIFQEMCNIMESSLRYDEREGEELHTDRAEYQEQLEEHMKAVDQDELLRISTLKATDFDGAQTSLDDQEVLYTQTTLMHIDGEWRVVHGFFVLNDEGEPGRLVHVLPENIYAIRRANS